MCTLTASTWTVPPAMRVTDVADLFFQSANLDSLAVVDGNEPLALLTRPKFMLKLFRRYSFELFGKNPIITLADSDPLIIEESERLEVTIDKALGRDSSAVFDEIIVVDRKGCFKGLLSVRQLIIERCSSLANSMVQKKRASNRACELDQINTVKSQFIAHVVRELRSPINAIIELTELLKMTTDKDAIEQIREILSLATSSATGLWAIITNIHELSKIEADNMEVMKQDVDVSALVADTAEAVRVFGENKPVIVGVTCPAAPVIVSTDPVKLRQIVMNLASNAAKLTPSGKVSLTLGIIGSSLEISVGVPGIGIKQEYLSGLSTATCRLEDAETKICQGTGAGLSISKHLTELLGCTISVISVFGRGMTLVVSLPLQFEERRSGLYNVD
ncbi:MAG TPA: ATP-binding protein [Nitrospirota bacterium]|nr:ATP-binding protein [Nitrospirota bacterium]